MSDPYIVELDSILSTNKYPTMDFVKGDIGTNVIHIILTRNKEPIDLAGKTVTVTIRKPDNTTVVYNVNIIDINKVEFILDINALAVLGTVLATVEVYDGIYRQTIRKFQYKVSDSLNLNNNVASFSDYPILTKLIADVQNLVDVGENVRLDQENIRQINETNRNVYENYDPERDYMVNNKVYFNGSSYNCKIPSKGVDPTNADNWLLIVSKGDRGTQGSALTIEKSEYIVSTNGETNISLNFTSFNPLDDNLDVNCNGVDLDDGAEYNIASDNMSIDLIGWSAKSGDKFKFKIYKQSMDFNTSDGSLIVDKSINMSKLSDDIQEKLNGNDIKISDTEPQSFNSNTIWCEITGNF